MSDKNFADALGRLGWRFERGHMNSISVTGPGGIGCVVDKVANVERMIPEEVLFALAVELQREHTALRANVKTEQGGTTADIRALRRALRQVAQAHAWLAFGECRSYGADVLLLSPSDADAVARVALGEYRNGPDAETSRPDTATKEKQRWNG